MALLGLKAAKAIGVADRETVRPKELEGLTGIPGGSLRRALTELMRKRMVIKDKDGYYSIPAHAIETVKKYVEG